MVAKNPSVDPTFTASDTHTHTHTADTLTFVWIRYFKSHAITLDTRGERDCLIAAPGSHEPTVLWSSVKGCAARD